MSVVLASSQVSRIRLLSPPGTFILSTRSIQNITEPLLQRAVVLRILRYVSFHPWGSLRAQARRSKYSLDQIISRLWDPDLFRSSKTRSFVAGGGVLWSPVVVDAKENGSNFLDIGGRIKRPRFDESLGDGLIGWMATRQPPSKPKQNDPKDDLKVRLSPILKTALEEWDGGKGTGSAVTEVLWDCRFLLRFDLAKMPQSIKDMVLNGTSDDPRLEIRFWSTYFYPKVVVRPSGNRLAAGPLDPRPEEILHSSIESHKPSVLHSFLQKTTQPKSQPHKNPNIVTSDWIQSTSIRTLDLL